MVIWLQFQITPTYTVVKTALPPVSQDSESNSHGLLADQLACSICGLNQLFRYRRNLVWPQDFLPSLDEVSGPKGAYRAH